MWSIKRFCGMAFIASITFACAGHQIADDAPEDTGQAGATGAAANGGATSGGTSASGGASGAGEEPSTGGTNEGTGGVYACVTGQQRVCQGENGCDGTQICTDSRCWGACVCDDSGSGGTGNVLVDNDGDGYFVNIPDDALRDCNDANTDIHPFADEVCNGVDDDCDGDVDEGACGSGGTGSGGATGTGGCETGGTGGSGGGGNARTYTIRWSPHPLALPYLQHVYFQATINSGEWVTLCGTNPAGNPQAPVTVDGNERVCAFTAIPGSTMCYNVEGRYDTSSFVVEGMYNNKTYACWEDWGCSDCCQGCGQNNPVGRYRAFGDSLFEGAHFAQSSDWVGNYTLVPMTVTVEGSEYQVTAQRLTGHSPVIDIRWNEQTAGGCNICLTLP